MYNPYSRNPPTPFQQPRANPSSAFVPSCPQRSSIKENIRKVWHHQIKPQVNRGAWSKEEDMSLRALVERFGQFGRWVDIARELDTGRTAFACIQRWQTDLNTAFRMHRPWSKAEDAMLMRILEQILQTTPPSLVEWDLVAAYHRTRSAIECEYRAPTISMAFNKVLAKGPHLERSCRDVNAPDVKPFSSSEDLQLLMAVQKYGIAGGPSGIGGGYGIGSWALVATSLPSRSVSTCKLRYLELCDRFQPWTYAEDKKLYLLAIDHGLLDVYLANSSYRCIIEVLLPNFPGRSVTALMQRITILCQWCRSWTSLRKIVAGFVCRSDDGDVVGKQLADTLITPPKFTFASCQLLLHSPFMTQYLNQLKQAQVADPPGQAFHMISTWKRQKDSTTKDNTTLQSSSRLTTGNVDFLLLLDELISGIHLPNHNEPSTASESSHSSGDQQQHTNAVRYTPNMNEVRSLINQTQTSHLLINPIRQSLASLVSRSHNPTFSARQPDRKRISSLRHRTSKSRQRSSGKRKYRDNCDERKDVAQFLLVNKTSFWSFYNEALQEPEISVFFHNLCNLSVLRGAIPLICDTMIDKCLASSSFAPSWSCSAAKRSKTSGHLSCSITPQPPTTTPSSNLTNTLSHIMRSKLLELRRLCLLYGRRREGHCNPYALSTRLWSGDMPKLSLAERSRCHLSVVPPVLRRLPDPLATTLYTNSQDLASTCRQAIQRLVEQMLQSNDSDQVRVVPPNYATVMGFKSLLIYLPTLVRRGGSHLSTIVGIRDLLRTQPTLVENSPDDDTVLQQPLLMDQLDKDRVTSAHDLVSPAYTRFMSIGLSLFLWPGLMAGIPAQTMVDAGKRSWTSAFSKLPDQVKAYRSVPYSGPPRPKQSSSDSDDSTTTSSCDDDAEESGEVTSPGSSHLAKQRRIMTHRNRVAKRSRTRAFEESPIFSFTYYPSKRVRIYSSMPQAVGRLYSAGFRPKSILHLS